jgi:uncharacterized secreted protein with C-terminal beta-propeller domain
MLILSLAAGNASMSNAYKITIKLATSFLFKKQASLTSKVQFQEEHCFILYITRKTTKHILQLPVYMHFLFDVSRHVWTANIIPLLYITSRVQVALIIIIIVTQLISQ